jgi:hypothetical protein
MNSATADRHVGAEHESSPAAARLSIAVRARGPDATLHGIRAILIGAGAERRPVAGLGGRRATLQAPEALRVRRGQDPSSGQAHHRQPRPLVEVEGNVEHLGA